MEEKRGGTFVVVVVGGGGEKARDLLESQLYVFPLVCPVFYVRVRLYREVPHASFLRRGCHVLQLNL